MHEVNIVTRHYPSMPTVAVSQSINADFENDLHGVKTLGDAVRGAMTHSNRTTALCAGEPGDAPVRRVVVPVS